MPRSVLTCIIVAHLISRMRIPMPVVFAVLLLVLDHCGLRLIAGPRLVAVGRLKHKNVSVDAKPVVRHVCSTFAVCRANLLLA